MDPRIDDDWWGDRLVAERDGAMAAVLGRLRRRFDASSAAVYFAREGLPALAVAMVLDTRLGFVVAPDLSLTQERHSTPAAYLSGKPFYFDELDHRLIVEGNPERIQYIPFPLSAASIPLTGRDGSLGVLTLRWAPPRALSSRERGVLEDAVRSLSATLQSFADRGVGMYAPVRPSFVPVDAPEDLSAAPSGPSRPSEPGEGSAWGSVLRESARKSSFLYLVQRLGGEIAAATRVEDVVAAAYDKLVRPFGGTGMVLCRKDGARLRVVGAAGTPKEDVRQVDGILLDARAPENDAMRTRWPLAFDSARSLAAAYPDLLRYHDDGYRVFLPLAASGGVTGCCVLRAPRPVLTQYDDLAVFTSMLGHVAQSLERAHVHEIHLATSRTAQQSFLPRSLPQFPGVRTTARYVPALSDAGVGGDWYDVIGLGPSRIGLVVGDVEGHSMDAIRVMGQLRSGVRAYAAEGHGPADVLSRSSELLYQLDTELFATCCCMWVDLDRGAVAVASAGHHAPLVVDSAGRPVTVFAYPEPPLGIEPFMRYTQRETALPSGSTAALFTDGLLRLREQTVDQALGELFDRLGDHRTEDLEDLADVMVRDSVADEGPDDDSALLLMRYEGGRGGTSGRVARIHLDRGDIQGVGRVRHALRGILASWGRPEVFDALELLTSEVVTNALVHARGPVDVRLREYPDRVRAEVQDSDPSPPLHIQMDSGTNQESESGRGLHIVDALALAWGSSPMGRGKITWFEVG